MHRHRIAAGLTALLLLLLVPSAHGARWVQVQGPVLTPTLPWEGVAANEPTVIWDHGRYRLWYTAAWHHCRIGYAESRDGIHWAKRSQPLLRNACHSNVVKTKLGFHIYSVSENGRTLSVTATHDGIHMVSQPRTVMRSRPGMWDNGTLANTFAWRTATGWHMLYEGGHTLNGATTGWQVAFAHPGRGLTWGHSPNPLWNLGFDGGIVGGPWIDGNCLYFHATTVRHVLPTDIYRRCGSLQHPGKPELVVGRTQSWEVDQVADATIARAPGHRPLMLFSGLDNMRPYAAIGAAWLR
jgi:hypothetical protein